jgi:thiamine kinase-like enzyme
MERELSRDDCVGLMPEWKDLDPQIESLCGGITNKLYRVRTSDGGDYVVRVFGTKTELFIDRDIEARNLRLMESSGVTPKLVKYLPEKKATIVEFVPGKSYQSADFLREETLESLVRPIRKIHDSGLTLPRRFDPSVEVRRLGILLGKVAPEYPEFDIATTLKQLDRISELAAVAPSEYRPCHNDLLADNFIRVAESEKYAEPVYIIDWEYAGMSTPYYELADMFQEILVPRDVEEKILRIYWGDRNIDEQIRLTDMFRPFPDIFWFLWSLIQMNISQITFDYYDYGKVKFENAQKNIRWLSECYGLSVY